LAKKVKRYLDSDVLTEAKKRIHSVLRSFDHFCVSFSGGKDSLVTLELVRECQLEAGLTGPTEAIFRDEELIPQGIVDFVRGYMLDERWNLHYYAVPLESEKFILGRTQRYVQWDPNRRWIRPKPEWAIAEIPGYPGPFSQYNFNAVSFPGVRGRIAVFTGIRADESLMRLQAIRVKRNEPWVAATATKNVSVVRAIYDWRQDDIFKYLHDRKIAYCSVYDSQLWNGQQLRVSTPLHAEQAKRFDQLRCSEPVLYEQVIDVFPEMLVQERYWGELDRYGIIAKYERSWNGIYSYIRENITDTTLRRLARERVDQCRRHRESQVGLRPETGCGYPLLYVFKNIVRGAYKRHLLPCCEPTKDEIEYEASS